MTNEEAKSELQALVTHYNAFSKESEAICKAIEALKMHEERTAEPCEDTVTLTKEAYSDLCLRAAGQNLQPCEDCISREAALNGFRSGRVCDEVAEDCIRDCQFCNDDGNCMIMKFLDGLPSVKPIAENATTTEDCVSRREAVLGFEKDVVCNFIGDCGICQFYQDESCLMTKFLYSLPSVKPTRPKGEWKLVREINGVCMYKCSLCGRLVLAFRGGVLENYPYCNCGAEMEANNE